MSNSDISNDSDCEVCILINWENVVGQTGEGPGWVVGSVSWVAAGPVSPSGD